MFEWQFILAWAVFVCLVAIVAMYAIYREDLEAMLAIILPAYRRYLIRRFERECNQNPNRFGGNGLY